MNGLLENVERYKANPKAQTYMMCAQDYMKDKRWDKAVEYLQKLIVVAPDLIPAYLNLAVIYDIMGKHDDTLPLYDRAISIDPNNVPAHYFRALVLLSHKNIQQGMDEYLWRFKRKNGITLHDTFNVPFWKGEPVEGKHVLVWTEQGIGDEIFILGQVPNLLRQGATVTVVCSSRLVNLVTRSLGCKTVSIESVREGTAEIDNVDYQASISELVRDTQNRKEVYLEYDSQRRQDLNYLYHTTDEKPETIVGIHWKSKHVTGEENKSVALKHWLPILRVPNCRFVSLQYGDVLPDIRAFNKAHDVTIHHDPNIDSLHDLAPFADQVAAMDIVISVSSTTAHLAGALGREVWNIATTTAPGKIWYWFSDTTFINTTPWYPSMTLFRHGENDKQQVMKDIAVRLNYRVNHQKG